MMIQDAFCWYFWPCSEEEVGKKGRLVIGPIAWENERGLPEIQEDINVRRKQAKSRTE